MAVSSNKKSPYIIRKTILSLIAVLCFFNVSGLYQKEGILFKSLLNLRNNDDQPTTTTTTATTNSFNKSNDNNNNNNIDIDIDIDIIHQKQQHQQQHQHQHQKQKEKQKTDDGIPPPQKATTKQTTINNKNKQQSSILLLSKNERPNCGSGCLYFYWTGNSKLPPMYEACLKSAIKVFGRDNIVVVSSVLEPSSSTSTTTSSSWQMTLPPVTIWNLTTYDISRQLADVTPQLHNYSIWENFLSKLNSNAHIADFVRIALIYLYGGIYTDFDNLWIKPIPLQYPVGVSNNNNNNNNNIVDNNSNNNNIDHNYPKKWIGKTLFRVRVDKRRKGKKLITTNNYNYTHNAVVGGIPRSSFHRRILEVMPSSYNPNYWVSIGDAIISPTVTYCNCLEDFVEIEYIDMYGIYGADATRYYNQPIDVILNPKDRKVVDHVIHESYQLHLFGSKTKSTEKLPTNGSLYSILLDHLNISVTGN